MRGSSPASPAFELLHEAGLAESRTEARKLIKGGGGRLNDKPIAGDTAMVGEATSIRRAR